MFADQGGTAVADAPAKADKKDKGEKKKIEPRQYGIFVEKTLNLADEASSAEAVKGLIELLPADTTEIVVYARVGRAFGLNPKQALSGLGQVRDLNGTYETIAESAISTFPGVSTAQKRSVNIG